MCYGMCLFWVGMVHNQKQGDFYKHGEKFVVEPGCHLFYIQDVGVWLTTLHKA